MTRILIVDDKEENLRYLEVLLGKHGYSVESARNGAEALAKAQQAAPDLVISDLLMPVMDGYTLLRHWKTDPVLSRIPFIVYTATFTDLDDRHFGESLGADAYILKPAKMAEFLASVRQVLAKTAVAAPLSASEEGQEDDDSTTLKYYSERLIRKLEEKTLQLERTNQALQQEIREHQKADEQLRFNNAILRTQQENSLDAILVVSVDGRVLSYNSRMLELWGVRPDILDQCRDVPLQQSPAVMREITRALEDPAAYLAKIRHLHEHDEETSLDEVRFTNGRILEVYSAPAIGANAQHYGRIWYYRDVTESRLAKASLEASLQEQRQLRELLEIEHVRLVAAQQIAKVGSWETDLATMTVLWSAEVHRIFETDPETHQPTHESFLALAHPDDRAAIDKAFRESLTRIGDNRIEHRLLLRSGKIKTVEENWRIYYDDHGRPLRALGTCLDITEHRALAESLREKAVQLSNAQRIGRMGSWSSDVRSGRLIWTDATCELFGIRPEEFAGTFDHFRSFILPDDLPAFDAAYGRVSPAEPHMEMEYRIRRPDGSVRWLYARGNVEFDAAGVPVSRAGMIMDITEQRHASEQLARNTALLRIAGRVSKVGGWSVDARLGRLNWSDDVCLLHDMPIGYSPTLDEAFNFYPEDFRERIAEAYAHCEQRGIPFDVESPLVTARGRSIWVRVIGEALGGRENGARQIQGAIQDITEQKAAEAQLAYLHRVRAVLSGINGLIARAASREELFREACQIAHTAGAFRMVMLCIVDPVTQQILPVASQGKDEALMDVIRTTLSSAETVGKTMVMAALRTREPVVANDSGRDERVLFSEAYRRSGVQSMAVLPLLLHGKPIGVLALYAREIGFFQKDELSLLTEMADDIAFAIDRIEKQERLDYLANFDTLTGLANRDLFLERLRQRMDAAAVTGTRLCVALTNLARFKNINDTLGRGGGDTLLRLVAEWLIRNTGDASQLARTGADEFAVVFDVRPQGDLIKLFETLNRTLEANSFSVNDTTLRISTRSGIAVFPDDGSDADTLLRNAEAALKEARSANERFKFYTREMNLTVASRLLLENQLRQAISNEEFELYYQPKVSLLSGRITGAEALIRWNAPQGELVLPGRFIPILEETGMIADVGQWALRTALADFLRWQTSGLPAVRIAVNVSPLQLSSRKFIAHLQHESGLDAHTAAGLELEITESVIMDDIQASTATLHAIRAMGITIAIDDFGTGFSSLGYLAKLPVDALKIDRSFVIDMTASSGGLALVSTIIGLAHALNLKVVAEGVETDEQVRLLRLLKCDEIQGYALGRPVPRAEFESKFLREDFRLAI